ncbi:uncharacterized protein PG986_003800 [Apiospora aurea]|uniref:Dynein light intermediate chain n=1 Tax=Apiospora aurea TaxID=335848 RepID=A0ABR1QSQ6_9PEZI
MTANTNRFSTYTSTSVGSGSDGKNGEPKKDMWSSMLDNVASGKRLPEKNMLVLGGTVESQRDFIGGLANNDGRRSADRQSHKIPPIANSFALGYTYYDVMDADQDDVLARVSLYLLSNPSPSFTSLVKPLLTPQTIPNTLIVILLDWSQPWLWMRQLREWVLLIRKVIGSLSLDCKDAMEEVMIGWKDRGRGGTTVNLDGTGAVPAEGDIALPLGPGEWEDGLGLPLCVVCQGAERIDYLEKTQGWREEKFDLVLQYLRTVLLKHGASLIYTSPTMASPLQTLVHASLGIHSLLKRQPIKHNVIDRDKIVVPPNWDSWSKIRILREGFDTDAVSLGWGIDLDHDPYQPPATNGANGAAEGNDDEEAMMTNGHANEEPVAEPEGSAVVLYEEQVQDTSLDALQLAQGHQATTRLEVEPADTQKFLAQQLPKLEAEKKVDEQSGKDYSQISAADEIISDHIGPVQFNMGGIQVDADDMVQRLKDRQAYGQSPEPSLIDEVEQEPVDSKPDTERLAQFFGNLMNRKPAGGGGK